VVLLALGLRHRLGQGLLGVPDDAGVVDAGRRPSVGVGIHGRHLPRGDGVDGPAGQPCVRQRPAQRFNRACGIVDTHDDAMILYRFLVGHVELLT
jgi:hypothetical protein